VIANTMAEECELSLTQATTELQNSAKFKWVLEHPWFRPELENSDLQLKKDFIEKLVDLETSLMAKIRDCVVAATKAKRSKDLETQRKSASEILALIRTFMDNMFAHLRANTLF
jgi:hypothetical protein